MSKFLSSDGNEYIANVKAFAIFFIVLMVIDMVLFIVTNGNVDRNYVYVVVSNLSLAGILQFLYVRFGKIGLYTVEIIVALFLLFYIVEIMLFDTYGIFMPLSSAINNAQNVTENYSDELSRVVAKNVTFIIRFLIFYAAFIVCSDEYLIRKQEIKKFEDFKPFTKKINIAIIIISALVFITSFLMIDKSDEFSTNVQKYGLKTAFIKSLNQSHESIKVSPAKSSITSIGKGVLDKYNILDIDFSNLDEIGLDDRGKDVNKYIASREASNKNELTGIFKGKNLILICAEAYSHHVIDKELTPTLYRLTNNGFKFTDFYVPSWGGSTTSGEFAFLTGLIPNDATECMKHTISKNMCFTMPRALKRDGYYTGAYHNGNYKYYDRNITHKENLGFDFFIANGNGIEDIAGSWPPDEEMIEKTFDLYKSHDPFCIYYMTLSGHAFYNDSTNFKVLRYIKRVKERYGDKYPEQVNNYICYQLYLEEALNKLVSGLEKNGLLDDTVICMTSDHFPYGLNSTSFTERINYISFLYEKDELDEFEIDKNMPILWCSSLEKEHKPFVKTIDTPTSTLDLLPTLLNLFGVKYDSRLLVGRDVFSDAEPFVVYNSGSFITKDVKYSKLSNKFVSNDSSINVKNYVDEYKEKARNLILFSSYVVTEDYYDYIFSNGKVKDDVKNNMRFSDLNIPITLAKKDYDHLVAYFKKCNSEHIKSKMGIKKEANSNNISTREKTVYLTFDDGPNNYNSDILNILEKNKVKATFFVVGTKYDDELKKIKDMGHTIGLHSDSHNYAYIYNSELDFLKDLYELQSYVRRVTGEYTHFLRFPGGSKNKVSDEINSKIMDRLRPLVEELGFEYYDWHVATGDSSKDTTKEQILSNIERGLINNYDELIILMHDLHPITVDALDDVIKLCKSYGYKIDKITDKSTPFHAIGVN